MIDIIILLIVALLFFGMVAALCYYEYKISQNESREHMVRDILDSGFDKETVKEILKDHLGTD